MHLQGIDVAGIATVIPQRSVGVDEWSEQFGADVVERAVATTGIRSVRVAAPGQRTSDLMFAAAVSLLKAVDLPVESVDAIVVVTTTPDKRTPATSCLLQDRLGLTTSTYAVDLTHGCSGYPYGMSLAGMLVSSGVASTVLLLAGDTLVRHLRSDDSASRFIFGDGASATVVRRGESFMLGEFHTDGSGAPSLFWDFPDPESGETHAQMNGVDVMQFALTRVPGLVRSLRSQFDEAKTPDPWTAVYLHQANAFAVNHLSRMCAMGPTRFPVAVERTGNTGPASIPMCISHDAGDHELGVSALVGFGVGWSWGGVVVDLSRTVVLPPQTL